MSCFLYVLIDLVGPVFLLGRKPTSINVGIEELQEENCNEKKYSRKSNA